MATAAHHQVVIVGGGTAGISVAARSEKYGLPFSCSNLVLKRA